jgi:symplekin
VLGQLAAKAIWTDATQWRGWVLCAAQTAPESFPALLALPAAELARAFAAAPPELRARLAAYAASPACAAQPPRATLEVLAAAPAGGAE